ncbi:hypothetical protein EVAR_20840_1 [Eumeta japonica]|uniref:Uncharacterized protein n=1 Tax=Eumeta variegata TaxID=151549 RepID=A0A4C1UEZ1_EUMVA|nr:hypothetical protein EVAR_20840_1 [Eumeta japonica]
MELAQFAICGRASPMMMHNRTEWMTRSIIDNVEIPLTNYRYFLVKLASLALTRALTVAWVALTGLLSGAPRTPACQPRWMSQRKEKYELKSLRDSRMTDNVSGKCYDNCIGASVEHGSSSVLR